MQNEDLIKKLEETSLPEIEILSHKRKLKTSLINQYFQEKRNWVIFDIFRKVVPIGVVVIILSFLIFNNIISPPHSLAKAREIALKDPQIKDLIERGAIAKDIEMIRNKAYVLVQPVKEIKEVGEKATVPSITVVPEIEEEFFGVLVEVDLKKEKVSKIDKIPLETIPLTGTEKERAKEIAENSPEFQKVIPKEAEILRITPTPPQLELIRKGKSVQVIPMSETKKKVSIIYQLGKNQWEEEIDLTEERAEEINFLGEVGE